MIIYKITNLVTNKIYIGQTIGSINKRWNSHCKKKTHCRKLGNSIQKYGKDKFTIEEIDRAEDLDNLNAKEIYWIMFYNSLSPNGYNLKLGGDSKEVHEETKIKISKSTKGRKGKPLTEETKEKIRKFNLGKKLSPETRNKMSKSRMGMKRPRTKEHSVKLALANTGKKMSKETKLKMSLAHKARWGKING